MEESIRKRHWDFNDALKAKIVNNSTTCMRIRDGGRNFDSNTVRIAMHNTIGF